MGCICSCPEAVKQVIGNVLGLADSRVTDNHCKRNG